MWHNPTHQLVFEGSGKRFEGSLRLYAMTK